jgi:hypothetical protein
MKIFKFWIISFLLIAPVTSQAAFDLSILNASNLNNVLPDDVASAAIKTFGIYFTHRPYQGATSIYGRGSLEMNFEVTMVKISNELNDALIANGLSSNTSSETAALPILKLNFRKALSPGADLGFSGIYYQGQYAIGTDIKFVLSNPEEGITTALRLGYSYATASILYLKSVTVLSPEFVMSRRIESAEPYLGFGGRYITGTISVPFELPPAGAGTVEKGGTGFTAYAFTGVNFQILGPKGFRFGMEGTYDISGFSSIGTTFGIGF